MPFSIRSVADAGDKGVGQVFRWHHNLEIPAFEVVAGTAVALKSGWVKEA